MAPRKVDTNHFKNKGSTDEECCVARSCSQQPGSSCAPTPSRRRFCVLRIINRRLGKMTTPRYFYWLTHTMRKTLWMFFWYPKLSEFSGISKCLGTFVLRLCRGLPAGCLGTWCDRRIARYTTEFPSKFKYLGWVHWIRFKGTSTGNQDFYQLLKRGFPVDFPLIQLNSMNDPTSSFTPEIFRHVGFTQCQAVTMPNLSPFSMGEIQTSPLNGSCLWQWGFATVSFIQILVLKGCELQSWWPSDMDHMGIIYEIRSHIVEQYLQHPINNTTRKGPLKGVVPSSVPLSSQRWGEKKTKICWGAPMRNATTQFGVPAARGANKWRPQSLGKTIGDHD